MTRWPRLVRTAGVVILLMSAGVSSARAQQFKLVGGVTLGTVASDGDVVTSRLPGAVFGGGLEWALGRVSPEVDVLWIQKRARYDSRAWDFTVSEISVPFVVAVRSGGRIAPLLLAGAEAAFILSAAQEDSWGGRRITYETPTLDYGLVIGGGIGFAAGSCRLSVEARYLHGLTRTMKFFSDGYDFRTRTVVITASLQ
jgi:hypothetical protein